MTSPFEPSARPARLRIDTDSQLTIDVTAPCFLAVYPNPDDPRGVMFAVQVHTPQQLAELTAAVIRYATAQGAMQLVMRSLTSTPTQLTAQSFRPLPPDTPPDDQPKHLRGT